MVTSRRQQGADALLKQGGFSNVQSEALVWAFELMTDNMATKADLETLKAEIVSEIRAVQVEQIKWMIGLTLGVFALTVGSVLTLIRFLVP